MGEGKEGRSLGHDHDEKRRKFKQKPWRLSTKRNLKMSRETNLQNRSWNACHSVNDGLIGLSDGVLLPVNNRLHCTLYSLKSEVPLPKAVTLILKNRILSDVTGCRLLNIYLRCEGAVISSSSSTSIQENFILVSSSIFVTFFKPNKVSCTCNHRQKVNPCSLPNGTRFVSRTVLVIRRDAFVCFFPVRIFINSIVTTEIPSPWFTSYRCHSHYLT